MTFWKTVGAVLVAQIITTSISVILYGVLILAIVPKQ